MMNATKRVPKLRFPGFSDEWEEKKLGDLAQVKTGNLNVEDAQDDGQFTFFDRSEAIKKYDEYSFDNEALIYGGEGSKFLPRYFKGKYGLHQRAYTVFNVNGTVMKFLYYFMLTQNNHFLRMAVGSTVKSLRMDCFTKCIVPVPDLEEQQEIAGFLGVVDDKISALRKKKELLQKYKKGIIQKIFSQEIRFKDQDRKDYPAWQDKTLGEIGKFYRGLTYNSNNVQSTGKLVLRSSNIQKGKLVLYKDLQFVNKAIPEQIKLKHNDIVVCMSNGSKRLVGKIGVFDGNYDQEITVGAFCSICRGSSKLLPYLFQTVEYRKYLHVLLSGTNINNLNNSDLEALVFKLPSSEIEQEKISEFLASIDEKIEAEERKLEQAKQFKKALLQQMFV